MPVGTFSDEITCLPRTLKQNGLHFCYFFVSYFVNRVITEHPAVGANVRFEHGRKKEDCGCSCGK